jgi:PHD/YefM family antitoxin component YafN of YafNO toxin-antitoxin module
MATDTALARPLGIERLARNLPSISATKLASGMQAVTSTVMARGAVVITRHERPAMVLMSVERYLQMEQASEPDLEALTHRFDDMFARMQGDAAAQAMADAFAMEPSALGDVAVAAATGQATRATRATPRR